MKQGGALGSAVGATPRLSSVHLHYPSSALFPPLTWVFNTYLVHYLLIIIPFVAYCWWIVLCDKLSVDSALSLHPAGVRGSFVFPQQHQGYIEHGDRWRQGNGSVACDTGTGGDLGGNRGGAGAGGSPKGATSSRHRHRENSGRHGNLDRGPSGGFEYDQFADAMRRGMAPSPRALRRLEHADVENICAFPGAIGVLGDLRDTRVRSLIPAGVLQRVRDEAGYVDGWDFMDGYSLVGYLHTVAYPSVLLTSRPCTRSWFLLLALCPAQWMRLSCRALWVGGAMQCANVSPPGCQGVFNHRWLPARVLATGSGESIFAHASGCTVAPYVPQRVHIPPHRWR